MRIAVVAVVARHFRKDFRLFFSFLRLPPSSRQTKSGTKKMTSLLLFQKRAKSLFFPFSSCSPSESSPLFLSNSSPLKNGGAQGHHQGRRHDRGAPAGRHRLRDDGKRRECFFFGRRKHRRRRETTTSMAVLFSLFFSSFVLLSMAFRSR